jgi:signal peptidase II
MHCLGNYAVLKCRRKQVTEDKGLLYYLIIALIVFLMDQASKYAVVKYMEIGDSIPLWEGVFHITSHRNAGAAFGILQNQRWFFLLITLIVLIGIILYLRRIYRTQKLLAYGLALIMGGAAGNFLDRLVTGEVVDFFDFTLINFAIFNVADSAIVIGVGLIILDTLLDMKKQKTQES